jgi:hypothetical protein
MYYASMLIPTILEERQRDARRPNRPVKVPRGRSSRRRRRPIGRLIPQRAT